MPKACLARRWAGLLPLRPTKEKSTERKVCEVAKEQYARAATEDGGADKSIRAFIRVYESLSRVNS